MSEQLEPIPYAAPRSAPLGPRELFGVIVRTGGLVVASWAIQNLLYALGIFQHLIQDPQGAGEYAQDGVIYAAIAGILLRGGWLVRWAYYGSPE